MEPANTVHNHALPSTTDVETIIVDAVVANLIMRLDQAKPGFCARLDDLPLALMTRVAENLHARLADQGSEQANVRLLSDRPQADWECHWTEAVRLRNPNEKGEKRAPFLLLVPPGSQLLGSLDTDTFAAIPCEHIVRDVVHEQIRSLPQELSSVAELLSRRDLVRSVSDMNRARYLLALAQAGYSREAAGLALCLLGLWPHQEWLDTGDQRDYWITRNKEVMARLRNGTASLLDRIYALKLTSSDQTRRLYDLLSSSSSIEAAAERVATALPWADLDFGRWDFASQPSTVVITVDPLALPKHEDGYPVLRLREQPYLQLSWGVDPTPLQVPDLTHYLVELISTSADTVDVAFTSEAITPGKSARKSFKLKNLLPLVQSDTLPEGLYRARVTAWARATNVTRQPAEGESAPNISGYFWIKDEGNIDEMGPLPPSRDRFVSSYLEARREVQWGLLERARDPWALPESTWTWDGAADGKAIQSTCMLKFGQQSFRIRMSNLLRRIESTILANPASLGALRADLTRVAQPRELSLAPRTDLPHLAADDAFLTARLNLFAKVRGASGQGTVETCDLLELRADILLYAQEYIGLLSDAEGSVTEDPQRWPDRVGLAAIDTIRLTLPGLSDQASVALLLAPTHPLRMLWSLQLALLAESWLQEARTRGSAVSFTQEAKQAFRGGLQPANIPPVLFDRRRIGYIQAGIVAPGWDIYLPADIADKQSALSRLSRALGYSDRAITNGTDTDEVHRQVVRYLEQHPYVGQLQVNVFNPGDGAAIVDLLAKLDKDYPDLRYDVRLFAHDSIRDDLGAALDQLVNPEVTVGETADKYSQSGKYALHPNLTYSKNRLADFLDDPRRYQAHLSLLLDMFRPRVDVVAPFATRQTGSLGGLVQEESVRCQGGQGAYAWERQVVTARTTEFAPNGTEARLLTQGLDAIQHFVAALGASPSVRMGQLPTVRLDLSVAGQNLLYEIHRVSDWVLTSDRHLGIDYFDSAADQDPESSPGILLDFSPEFPSTDRPVLMLTTQVDVEIEGIVEPVLQRLNLDQPGAAPRVIEWLRSLSGRLAIRLLTAPLAAQGVIGMALARAFLGQIGLLRDAIVIPVDAHIQLLRKGLNEEESENRTDLILVRRVGEARQIEFVLVEVKCKSGLLAPAAYGVLREEMENQVSRTQAALGSLFDSAAQSPDRIDRPLRNLMLSKWLRFYVGRSRRYGLLSPMAEEAMLDLIACLDDGYAISFRQAGLVFELGRDDDLEDSSTEFRVHRIGRMSCERLLRGEVETSASLPMWDRARDSLRGPEVWTRTSGVEGVPQASSAGVRADGTESAAQESTQLRAPEDVVSAASASSEQIAGSPDARPDQPRGGSSIEAHSPQCHYLLGDTKITPQWGVLGKLGADTVALDLNGCNTLSIFGVQGGGKSYTMGSILEMAVRPLPGLNLLPSPLAAVVFHYNESQDYAPEFVTMASPNHAMTEIARLRDEYGGEPASVDEVLVLTTEDKVNRRREEFPGLLVEPITFNPAELTIQDWRFLMGAVGNDSLYIREFNLLMRTLRDQITVDALRQGIEDSEMSEAQRKLARLRLRFAEQFVHDGAYLRGKLYPGRLIIVDLRDELIETDEALGLFVVMLRVFAGATHNGLAFSKMIAFDEAHKYIRNADLVDSVVSVIRQMRHQGTSVIIASQDPPSLPLKIMELSSVVMLHRMDSPAWLKYIQRAVTALGDLTAPALARLRPGEAYVWARSATDPMFTHRAIKIHCRPRATQHGGATREANRLDAD